MGPGVCFTSPHCSPLPQGLCLWASLSSSGQDMAWRSWGWKGLFLQDRWGLARTSCPSWEDAMGGGELECAGHLS